MSPASAAHIASLESRRDTRPYGDPGGPDLVDPTTADIPQRDGLTDRASMHWCHGHGTGTRDSLWITGGRAPDSSQPAGELAR